MAVAQIGTKARRRPRPVRIARDKVNLDITWLKDASLEDADALLPPEEIVEDLEAALREFAAIADALSTRASQPTDS
ncbi:hypothetical protein KBX63_15160 [Micromonospora sp. U21]|nr:hypothetical protein [Micromonospora sp. U21]